MAFILPRPTTAPSSSSSSSADSNPGSITLSSSKDDHAARSRRQPPRNQYWTFHDEVKILTAKHHAARQLRGPSALLNALRGNLRRENPTAGNVAKKVHNLRERFRMVVASGGSGNEHRDRMLYELSMEVWQKLLPSSSTSDGTE